MLDPQIFKANDIRGIVGSEWDEAGAKHVGGALVAILGLAGQSLVLGRDMRTTGPEMSRAFIEGALQAGANVIDIGLSATDQLWFASGMLNLPGVQFTASHNPGEYNGIKFCLEQAAPVTSDFLRQIAEFADEVIAPQRGTCIERDVLADYAGFLRSLVDLSKMRPLKVVVDAGNGMAGHTVRPVLGGLGIEIIGLFLELDGSFPNHQPNPLIPENLVDAQRAVIEHSADLALVFDGDADRCFIIDETGTVVDPSIVTAMIARQELLLEPGAGIVINTITSRAVAEVVAESGGELFVSRVGHTSVKALMAEHDAVFGGEHSAHYYFRDFWGADTGMLAALHVLAMVGRSDRPLSKLREEHTRYVGSGEINSTVADAEIVMQSVASAFEGRGEQSWVDGLLISGPDYWVSVRPSNTEPLLRLNVEAKTEGTMVELRDLALRVIREGD